MPTASPIHQRIRWTIILVILAASVIMTIAGIYALKISPTLFFEN